MRYISTYLVVIGLCGCVAAKPVPPAVKPGHDQLDLVLPNFPGPGSANLGALEGKVVFVDFWATWCGPCHEASSAFERLYQQFHAQGLEVYGVSVDEDASQVADFVKQQGVTYPILLDPSAEFSQQRFDLSAIPSVLIADRSGKIRFTHAGYDDGELALLTREIQQLLAEPAPAP